MTALWAVSAAVAAVGLSALTNFLIAYPGPAHPQDGCARVPLADLLEDPPCSATS